MDRDRVIELLIRNQLEKLGIGQHSRRFLRVVEREFHALGVMSDEELAAELARRGIAAEFESDEEQLDEPDEEEGDDEDEEVIAMTRHRQSSDDDWAPSFG